MSGSSYGGCIGFGMGLSLSSTISLQGELTYRYYGKIKDWKIKIRDAEGDEDIFEMTVDDFESDGQPGDINTSGISFGLDIIYSVK